MKKHFLIFVSMLAAIVMFTACANPSDETDEKVNPGAEESIKIDTSVTTALSESEETSQTTEESTVHTTEADTSAPDENIELALNMDLIEEYGMSFGELKAKHGDVTDFHGGQFYKFENGYADYGFYIKPNTHDMVTDSKTGVEYQRIDENEKCWFIEKISPDSLFNKSFETLTIEKISRIEGVTNIKTVEDGIVTSRAYATVFNYEGWNNDNITITIYHEDKDMIDHTSAVSFYIHPLVLDSMGIGPYHTEQ